MQCFLKLQLMLIMSLMCIHACAADISYTPNLMFVSDRIENQIDVIDVSRNENVFRIDTEHHPDSLVAMPHVPILVYANIDERLVVFYDLKKKQVKKQITLEVTPRHLVLDPTGTRIAVTDSITGGLALLSPYSQSVAFTLEDFPATTDVLFDLNEVDIFYSNAGKNAIGVLDINTQKRYEMSLAEDGTSEAPATLTSPSRSLDGRYVYVGNIDTGEVFALNAYSKIIYRTFQIGRSPARPYTSPAGYFLYLMNQETGKVMTVEQNQFKEHANLDFKEGVDLVAVGRFDRMNVFLSTGNRWFRIYDNLTQTVIKEGQLKGTPLDVKGSVDGISAYVSFSDIAEVAQINLESQELTYISATTNGSAASSVGLTNNVCH